MSVKRTLTTANALVRFRQTADVQGSLLLIPIFTISGS